MDPSISSPDLRRKNLVQMAFMLTQRQLINMRKHNQVFLEYLQNLKKKS